MILLCIYLSVIAVLLVSLGYCSNKIPDEAFKILFAGFTMFWPVLLLLTAIVFCGWVLYSVGQLLKRKVSSLFV